MTRERAKELLPVIQAFAEGKTVQIRSQFTPWETLSGVNPTWSDNQEYRIKPEPKLRPWRSEEVPVGCLMRYKGTNQKLFLFETNGSGYLFFGYLGQGSDGKSVQYAFDNCEHSLDHGKTWLPCGIVEETI